MWVRKHQGGNDWAGSAFSGPPWSFHESLLSGTLPGRGAMALLFYRFLDLTHSQNHLSMSLFMFPGIFLRESLHPEAITFLLDFSPGSTCSLTLLQGGPRSPLESLAASPRRRARLLSAKAIPGHPHAGVHPPSRLSLLSKVEKGPKVSTSTRVKSAQVCESCLWEGQTRSCNPISQQFDF